MAIDLRACLNAISDVVNNRPRPLREFDQIFMKTADMLLQTEHVGRLFEGETGSSLSVTGTRSGSAWSISTIRQLLEYGPLERPRAGFR